MTRQEFSILAKSIKTIYPKENILNTQEEFTLWFEMLEDIPYKVASAGLKKWVMLNRWAPSISDMRAMSVESYGQNVNEWEEEWDKVTEAIGKYGYYQSDKALKSLPDLTRTIVKRLGFRNLCMSENISIERANFRDIYNREAEKIKKDNILSNDLKSEIQQIGQSAVLGIEEQG